MVTDIDRYGNGESDHLIFYDGDTGSIHLFSGDVISTINSSMMRPIRPKVGVAYFQVLRLNCY